MFLFLQFQKGLTDEAKEKHRVKDTGTKGAYQTDLIILLFKHLGREINEKVIDLV